ncbi:MAG: hypothetical protein ACOCZ7_04455, partial [Armatimonadota bacterium]
MRMMLAGACVLLSTACCAQVPEGWFEYTISVPAQGSAVDVSGLSVGSAGVTGPVTIADGHFVDGSGERIRFLGTNLTFDDAFPPKEIAPEIARRMAALG